MKIALIDNMNNNLFVLQRYFRDMNYSTALFLVDSGLGNSFYPGSDTYEELTNFNIKKLPDLCNMKFWLKSVFKLTYKKYFKQFKEYDVVIACGPVMAYLAYFNIKVDIVIPYGADLYKLTLKNQLNSFFKNIVWNTFSFYQGKALKNCHKIVGMNNSILVKDTYKKYTGKNHVRLPIPLVYRELAPILEFDYWDFLNAHDFIVFNHSRQYWKTNVDKHKDFSLYGGDKRNDKLIRAFATLTRRKYYKNPILVLFEYGPDVEASKELITQLNIAHYVTWVPKMERKVILSGLIKADFGYNQCRENISGMGGTLAEILSCGVHAITFTNGETEDETSIYYGAPINDILHEEEIYQLFIGYANNRKKFDDEKLKIKEWFDNTLGLGLANKYAQMVDDVYNNKQDDMSTQ